MAGLRLLGLVTLEAHPREHGPTGVSVHAALASGKRHDSIAGHRDDK
jgi:hypothetical protein